MRIALKLDWQDWLVFGTNDATAILNALPGAERMHEESKWFVRKEDEKWIPEIRLIPEEMLAAPDPLEKTLRERIKETENSWLNYYNKFNESEKRVKELQGKLDSLKKAVGEEPL
jgi:hypothetical protein